MRSVTCLLSPEGDEFDPVVRSLREGDTPPEAVHVLRTLADGSVVAQVSVRGEPCEVHEAFDGRPARLHSYEVADADGGTLVQLHFRPGAVVRRLLEGHRRHAVVPEFPLRYVDERAVRVVEVGHAAEVRALVSDVREVATVTIEEVGSYEPDASTVFAALTERQQQVLGTALEQGYYDVPRDVTYEDIAGDLDCSASTVGQHLRRIEATVLEAIAPADRSVAAPESPAR